MPATAVLAEQSGDTPESGAVSYIKQIYDSVVTLGYGSDSEGRWGNWGAMWNRIRSAAEWMPSGTAGVEDVAKGKTFYSGSRALMSGTMALTGDAGVDDVVLGKTFYSNSLTKLVGTAPVPFDYSLQALSEYDDCEGDEDWTMNPGEIGDYQGEESTWTNTLPLNGGSEEVWKDERTGLYWSHLILFATNEFQDQDHSSCLFFDGITETDRMASRYSYDGLTSACGDAINTCGSLELDADVDGVAETEWYLPSQKELLQAYIDGIYNQAGIDLTTRYSFWSSTEVSDYPDAAWHIYLHNGSPSNDGKGFGEPGVRCVTRK